MTAFAPLPAINDADLARLLGLASTAPPPPAGLAERIAARMLIEPPAAAPLPALRPVRRRRWLRIGLGTGASLLLATAVAAGLAQAPVIGAYLQPLLAPLVGLMAPEPPRAAAAAAAIKPAARAAPVPVASAALADVAAPQPPPPAAAVPNQLPNPVAAPVVAAPVVAAPSGPAALRPVAGPQRPLTGVPEPRAAAVIARSERTASERVTERAAERQSGAVLTTMPNRLPETRAALAERGVAGAEAAAAVPAVPTAAAADAQRIAPQLAPAPAAAASNQAAAETAQAGQATDPALPAAGADRAAAITGAIAELRAARKAGRLTPAQAQRLQALQQLRSARAARAPRAPDRR